MKTTFYFVRHGAVENPGKVIYGRLPGFPLSSDGRAQIEKLAKLLANKEVSTIYTSPQLRCRQTAGILARKQKLPIKVSSLIQETGTSFDSIPKAEFERIEAYLTDPEKLPEYPRETVVQIARRMKRFLYRVTRSPRGRTVVVVTHGDPMLILRANLSGRIFNWDYKKNNYIPVGGYFKITV